MYIEIKLMKNNGDETGFEYFTPTLSEYVSMLVFNALVELMTNTDQYGD